MYTQVAADLYTGQLAGGQLLFPVGTRFIFTNLAFLCRSAVPFGFCCGGFSSTAGYVPGNEARYTSSEEAGERRSTQAVDHSRRASLVFIRVT